MSGETKFVCQRREFRLVVPADGSNEIPRRLKSCQLLSVSLSLSPSHFFSPPHPSASFSSCYRVDVSWKLCQLEFRAIRSERKSPPVAGEAKKSPGKLHGLSSRKAAHHEEFSLANSFSLSLSLYTTRRERKRCSRDHCYFGKLKKAVPVVEKMIYKCKFILSTLYMSASNHN